MMFVPMMSEGIRSGRELHAGKLQVHGVGERAHQHGLAQARDAFEQDVAGGEKRDERRLDDLALADDHASEFVAELAEFGAELFDLLLAGFGGGHEKFV